MPPKEGSYIWLLLSLHWHNENLLNSDQNQFQNGTVHSILSMGLKYIHIIIKIPGTKAKI